MKTKVDSLVVNSSNLITLSGHKKFRTCDEMNDLGIIKNGAVAISNNKILETGTLKDITAKYFSDTEIDAKSKLVMPGLVDCHTHLVFAGSREYELALKLSGASYLEILKAGGGIHSTVNATRNADIKELEKSGIERLDQILSHGTTSVEIKSGYGLSYEAEKKILNTINLLKCEHRCDITSTFLGAHTVPKDMNREDYIDMLVNKAIPDFKNLTEFCDIFSEKGAFTYDETEKILKAAIKYDYKLKIHSGQFNDIKATGLAAKLGALSADHLENVSVDQLDMMKTSGTAAVLMPGVSFFLMSNIYPDARKMISNGNIVALATDFNPGSCPSYSMQMMIALACYKMKMSPEEAITAATINSAYAIDKADEVGSLEVGKKADLLIMEVSEAAHIPYYFGANLVKTVIKNGDIV